MLSCKYGTNTMKNIKIGNQLLFGIFSTLFFVLIMGYIAYDNTNKLHEQTQIMYEHPLQTRRSLSIIKSDLLRIQREMNAIILEKNPDQISNLRSNIDLSSINASEEIKSLYQKYLGPPNEIDSVKESFHTWMAFNNMAIRLFDQGKKGEAIETISMDGLCAKQANHLINSIEKLEEFAKRKGDSLFQKSTELNRDINIRLSILVIIIFALSFFINYFLLQNIQRPIKELIRTTLEFQSGNLRARSSYDSKNEFGTLSKSFNRLADSIQFTQELNEKTDHFSALMLSENDPEFFFKATLHELATSTNSQIAAIYFLNEDKSKYEHLYSIGMDASLKQAFHVKEMEGEFGALLISHQVQYIKEIEAETRFAFQTVSGILIPKEIMSLPIISNSEIVAIISLASIHPYNREARHLIDKILPTLSARIVGVNFFQKTIEFSKKLEVQNNELETINDELEEQKAELAAQSDDLIRQNNLLESQKNKLREMTKLKTNFLSNMSHELRTPLNSVIALSGVLSRKLAKQIPEEEYSYLEVIERNGKNLLTLINDILDISRIEAGREDVEIQSFHANHLISELVSMIEPQAKQKKIELIQLNPTQDCILNNDMKKCRHILQNLIGNAVKFTQKGKVEIMASIKGDQLLVKVKDTGIGIAEDHLEHIFEEFRQADGSTSRRFGGTGLGLAIAKKYANFLGGTISVSSVLGVGSEFTLKLPIHYHPDNAIIEEEVIPDFRTPIKSVSGFEISKDFNKTILLVEDSEPAIIQMKDFLKESGFNVLVAHHGKEGLEIIEQTIPDAMVLDLMMPGMDGLEVLKTMRNAERTSHIPVLILTAKHIEKEELLELKKNNIHQLIQKGDINKKDLLEAISSMVFPPKKQETVPKLPKAVITGKPKILVVEDNADNMVTVKALFDNKYILIEAVNGTEGVVKAKESVPNLILMDIALPGIDGIEAFRQIREDPNLQHIPIIALTASAMIHDREAILSVGFDSYIPKPIDEKIFMKTINEILYGG